MKKSTVWLGLAAASLMLAGCGGSEPAEQPKPAAKKKGDKVEPNPWAKDSPDASEPAPKKKTKAAKGKQAEAENPWAKDPPPGSQPVEPAKKQAPKKKKGEDAEANPWAKETPNPVAT